MPKTISTRATVLAGLCALHIVPAGAMEPSHLEHTHSAGTWMFDYRYMHMKMDGLRAGRDDVSPDTAVKSAMMGGLGYMMAPTEMTMGMHMFMPMYNFTAQLSVMAMFQYLDKTMDMVDSNGVPSSMETSGVGDTVLSINYKLAEDRWAMSLGVSLPTGSIDEQVTMMNVVQQAPYAMQLGSGTVDLTPALTYLGGYYDWRYGAQLRYTRRLGKNDNGYTLGDQAGAQAWVHRPVGPVNLWLKGDYLRWGDIEGRDPDIITQMTMNSMTMKTAPTAFTSNYGGSRAEVSLAAEMAIGGPFTLGLELTQPVYQDLNGDAQMKAGLTGQTYLQLML